MKLYDVTRAPNPRRVRIFMAEKGISCPLVPIDLAALEHKSESFSALNPGRRVPALELDDGTVIGESIAICRYFEEIQPEPALFGTGPVGRATVEMWQRRIEFELLAPAAAAFRHVHPAMAAMEVPQVPAWGEANRQKVQDFLVALDAHLAERPFMCGDAFSVADITGLVAVDFLRLPKLAVPESLGHLRRWHAAVGARPSAAA